MGRVSGIEKINEWVTVHEIGCYVIHCSTHVNDHIYLYDDLVKGKIEVWKETRSRGFFLTKVIVHENFKELEIVGSVGFDNSIRTFFSNIERLCIVEECRVLSVTANNPKLRSILPKLGFTYESDDGNGKPIFIKDLKWVDQNPINSKPQMPTLQLPQLQPQT